MFRKEFYFLGDGVTRMCTVDLAKAPVGMDFKGENYPQAAYLEESRGIKISTDAGKLYLEFAEPLEKDEISRQRVTFYY